MPETISWLHISDLHMNPSRTGWDSNRVIRTLVDDLQMLQKTEQLRPDLIFFTGDLAFGGADITAQLMEGHRFLESIRLAFTPHVERANVFIVPGNHDVNRAAVTDSDTHWLDTAADEDKVNEMIRAGALAWTRYSGRLNEYRDGLSANGYDHLLTDPTRLTYGAFREVAGRRIGIAGFNSAWTCCRSEEKGKLWVGAKWQVATLEHAVHEGEIRIALTHHPEGWINPYESNAYWKQGVKGRFHVCLHGHEHDSWAEQTNANLTISAGACYENSAKPTGYNIVRLFPQQRSGEVWFRRYEPRGGQWGPDFIAGITDTKGVAPLESIRWLKPRDPPPESDTSSEPTPDRDPPLAPAVGDLPTTQTIVAQAEVITKAVEAALASQPHEKAVLGAAKHAVTATRVTRVSSHQIAGPVVIVNVFLSNSTSPIATSVNEQDVNRDRLQAEFAQIDRLTGEFRIDDADRALNDMLDAHAGDLTERERFRLGIKRGHILYARRDISGAAAAYREAIALIDSSDKHARYFAALAAEFEGSPKNAHESAILLWREFPEFETAAVVSLCIRTAPAELTVADLHREFGSAACELPDVAYTLARRASDEGLFDEAVRLAEIAVDSNQDSADAKSTLAGILLEKAFGKIVTAGHSRPPSRGWKDFDRVSGLLLAAIADVERGKQNPAHAAALRQNLAVAYTAVGRSEDALAEYRKAYQLRPSSPEIAYRYAMTLGKGGQVGAAIQLLREWLNSHHAPEITLLLAQFLGTRLTVDSVETQNVPEALELLDNGRGQLPTLDDDLRADWIAVHVQLLSDAGRFPEARQLLESTPNEWLGTPLLNLLTADLEDSEGNRAAARAAAVRAAAAIDDSTSSVTVRQVGISLEELGLYDGAAAVWRRLASMKALGVDEQHVLVCLQKAGDREALIEVCRELRVNGVLDDVVINTELAALERISFERLASTLAELIESNVLEKAKREYRAQLSYVSIFTGKQELIEQDSAKLPRVLEVENARAGRMVVEVLRRGPQPFSAVTYAYELFRRFPDQPDSYLAVIFSTGVGQQEVPIPLPESTRVAAGCAVKYVETDSSEEVWCIIEDLPNPSPVLLERAPSDSIARALMGTSPGSIFTLRASPSPRRDATVLAVVSKYVYRFQDCLTNFERRFPEHENVIWSIHAGEDGKAGIDAVLRQVDERVEHQRQIDELFRSSNVTLALYAQATGRSIFEAVHRVSSSPDLHIQQCVGSVAEQAVAMRAAQRSTAYILDATAVATLYLLSAAKAIEAETVFDGLACPLVVSEHTLTDARAALSTLSTRGGMAIDKVGDTYVRHVLEASEAQREHERLKGFVEMLRRRCSVVPAEDPSPANAESYRQLVSVLGRSGAESVRLASRSDGDVLWTDELYTAQLAVPQLGSRRVWTKLLVDRMAAAKKITEQEAAATAIALFTAGYRFTSLGPESLFLAAKRSDWKAYKEPLRSLLSQYGDGRITAGSAAGSAAGFLHRVWTLHATRKHEEIARLISVRLIKEVLKRPDGREVAAYIRRTLSITLSRSRLAKAWRSAYRYALNH